MTGDSTDARDSARSLFSSSRGSGTAAAQLRLQGRVSRPHIVWVNESTLPGRRSSLKPGKKD